MNTIELTKNKVVKFLGKDPKMFTRADIIDYVVKNDIEMINFMYPAADGRLKTLNFIINDLDYLKTILTSGERVDGSSLFPAFIEAGNSDLYVVPRYSTAFLDPFAEIPTVTMLCSFFDKDGNRIELQNDGAYVCRRIADANNLKVGDTFVVKPYGKDKEYKLTVKAIVSSVAESVIVTADYADNVGVEYMFDSVYTAQTADQLPDDPTVVKAKQKVNEVIDSFNSMMELMTVSVTVLVIAALVLGVVVLYNLGVMSYTERYREMATLKVVGFKDSAIGKLLTAQNLWVTLFGMIVGLPLGILTLRVLINALASEYEMQAVAGPVTYIVSILLTFGMSLLVSLLVARKNKQIDMVEALKMNE